MAASQGGHHHNVLLVDDHDASRVGLTDILRNAGFFVISAWAGEDALRHLREGFRPCVMLLDLRMPGMNGWQLWDSMRANPELATIPVVIVSADVDQRERAQRTGVRDFP